MTNSERIISHNALIDEALVLANALPDATGGGTSNAEIHILRIQYVDDDVKMYCCVSPTEFMQVMGPGDYEVYGGIVVFNTDDFEITSDEEYAVQAVDGWTVVKINGLAVLETWASSGGGGGGLPENLAAIDCGIYTAPSTSSATVNVPHKMGVIPDFCLWMIVKSCEGEPVAATNVTGCLVFKPCKLSSSSSDIYEGFQAITGYNASKALARTASAVLSNPMTDTYACIVATTQYRLQAGDSYFWIVGKFKD